MHWGNIGQKDRLKNYEKLQQQLQILIFVWFWFVVLVCWFCFVGSGLLLLVWCFWIAGSSLPFLFFRFVVFGLLSLVCWFWFVGPGCVLVCIIC